MNSGAFNLSFSFPKFGFSGLIALTRGYPRLEVSEKDAMKTDDRNHPKSLQYENYDIEK